MGAQGASHAGHRDHKKTIGRCPPIYPDRGHSTRERRATNLLKHAAGAPTWLEVGFAGAVAARDSDGAHLLADVTLLLEFRVERPPAPEGGGGRVG